MLNNCKKACGVCDADAETAYEEYLAQTMEAEGLEEGLVNDEEHTVWEGGMTCAALQVRAAAYALPCPSALGARLPSCPAACAL